MNLTAKQREVIERMANHERLSVRPSWGFAWLERCDRIEPELVGYDDAIALQEAGLIEVQEHAKPLVVMRLTELGRHLRQG